MSIPADLLLLQRHVFDPCGFKYTVPQKEAESYDYDAYSFNLNDLAVRYRKAKITPTKTGQFVTFWKREGEGPIQPYDSMDEIDFLMVCVRKDDHFGVFVFSKAILIKHGIVATASKEGKRALRIYPPWDIPTSQQAVKTQKWQQECFLEVGSGHIDSDSVNRLFTVG
ncbi:MAG: MepB family protein [Cyclobacteriaceae bacterium]